MNEEKQIAIIHSAILAVLVAAFAVFGTMPQAVNCLFGGVLIGLNMIAIVWSMKRFLVKKSFAFAGLVIVTKYAVFIVAVALLYSRGWRADLGFVIGLTSALPSVAIAAFKFLKQNETDGSL